MEGDAQVDIRAKDIPLHNILDLIMAQTHLTYEFRDHALVIRRPDKR